MYLYAIWIAKSTLKQKKIDIKKLTIPDGDDLDVYPEVEGVHEVQPPRTVLHTSLG